MSVTVALTEESARLALQEMFDGDKQEFADAVWQKCTHSPSHRGADLLGDLDDCYDADEDADVNFLYGCLVTIKQVAEWLGVVIDATIPPAQQEFDDPSPGDSDYHETWCPVLDVDSPMESHEDRTCVDAYRSDTGLEPPR